MSKVSICLDSYQYYPGNTIKGEATCYFDSPTTSRQIRLRLKGKESTQWANRGGTRSSGRDCSARSTNYEGKNDFLLEEHILYSGGTLPSGTHLFPIEITLPYHIPSSFHSEFGNIEYTVKCTVDRAYKFDYEDKKGITVISPTILENPEMLRSTELSKEKTTYSLWCSYGRIKMDVAIEKLTFVMGQSVSVKVNCMNMSDADVNELNVKIMRNIRLKATRPWTDHNFVEAFVAASLNTGVPAREDKIYNLILQVPESAIVPNFIRCKLFQVSYELKVTAVIAGCHADFHIKTDVAVVHPDESQLTLQQPPYSLRETIEENTEIGTLNPSAPSASEGDAPSAPSEFDLLLRDSGVANISQFETPPPSYNEAVKSFSLPAK